MIDRGFKNKIRCNVFRLGGVGATSSAHQKISGKSHLQITTSCLEEMTTDESQH